MTYYLMTQMCILEPSAVCADGLAISSFVLNDEWISSIYHNLALKSSSPRNPHLDLPLTFIEIT
jgi:hypothetical protein